MSLQCHMNGVLLLCRGSRFARGVALGSNAAELRTWLALPPPSDPGEVVERD